MFEHIRKASWIAVALAAAALPSRVGDAAGGPTVQLTLRGERLEGRPAAWGDAGVMLVGRDGQLWNFAAHEATNFKKLSDFFQPYTQSDMRGALAREFGERFDVSGTGHYLVVHPAGERDLWAERFENLYRQFTHYFTARGFRPQAPQFPLVAVVFHNQLDFARFAARDGVQVNGNMLGYYSPQSNRVLLFDVGAGRGTAQDWTLNADTIIHEATHQTAFNTGVHSRLTTQPKWACEGLATMFEARGVWNSGTHRALADRINRYRLDRFREYAKTRRKPGAMEVMIGSDRLFMTDADGAYAEAWAMTFYLAEREPRKYMAMLTKLAALPPMDAYATQYRVRDFKETFGENLPLMEAQMLRFVETLP
jgi:hypothetical protein